MSHVLPVYARCDLTFTRGEGVYLFDAAENRYLDLAAGIAVNSMGHSHPALVKALKEQGEKLWHTSNMYQIDGLEALATKICDATDFADYVFFCNSGAEAVEAGLKMIRKYQHGVGNPNKFRVITFEGAFHGRTLATISAAAKPKVLEGFEPAVDGFDKVPFGDLDAVEAAIGEHTGGILIEPVQGEGGVRVCSAEFLQGLRKLCDRHDLVLMFDGVQCGMGRTGKFFSHEWTGVSPDITSSAKGIAGGFPLGACLVNERVGKHMTAGSHGSTYGSNPLAVAVCAATMEVMLADGFLEHVVKVGDYFTHQLQQLAQEFPEMVQEVRGRGLMIGLRVATDSKDFVEKLRKKHVLTAPAAENVVRFLPPLILEEKHVDEGIAAIREVCKELMG